ncbi:hypothetical protein D046_8458, partial [Vibrio parahaemolyticus V-223/04]
MELRPVGTPTFAAVNTTSHRVFVALFTSRNKVNIAKYLGRRAN